MIKSIQYFAEADTTQVLVALDLKAAFQNVSRRAMLYHLGQHDHELATVYSRWYTGSTTQGMHYDGSSAHIQGNSGIDQGCPLSPCGFAAAIEPISRAILAENQSKLDDGPNCGPIWTTGTSGSSHSTSQQASNSFPQQPGPSTWNYNPPRSKYGLTLATAQSHQLIRIRLRLH